jgi:hypothetical protein
MDLFWFVISLHSFEVPSLTKILSRGCIRDTTVMKTVVVAGRSSVDEDEISIITFLWFSSRAHFLNLPSPALTVTVNFAIRFLSLCRINLKRLSGGVSLPIYQLTFWIRLNMKSFAVSIFLHARPQGSVWRKPAENEEASRYFSADTFCSYHEIYRHPGCIHSMYHA